jgi:uncharacterized protein (TIGR00299 family) protein
MSEQQFAIIDPAAGISGDMLLGALIDAGASIDWLQGLPARLGIPEIAVEAMRVDRNGVQATKVTITLPDGRSEGPSEPHGPGGHDHGPEGAHGPHRRVSELLDLVAKADVSDWVRERAQRAFELIGEAEGRVHGMPAGDVTLHELGALDALVDIVGGVEGFEHLGITRVYTRPLATGNGWVRGAHGVMPVPAPATAFLLEGLPIGPDGPVTGEATTPTGAALLRVLSEGLPPGYWRPLRGGWGAGSRNPDGYANALRVIVAEGAAEAQEVVTVATDLDDLSPEYIEPLRVALTEAGALDVQVWSTSMKKGRPGFRVEALVVPEKLDHVTEAFFRHSTTAGVRTWRSKRVTLPRRQVVVDTPTGPAHVKLLDGPDGVRAKAEYDDVVTLARAERKPAHRVAADLQERALRLVPDTDHRSEIPKKE